VFRIFFIQDKTRKRSKENIPLQLWTRDCNICIDISSRRFHEAHLLCVYEYQPRRSDQRLPVYIASKSRLMRPLIAAEKWAIEKSVALAFAFRAIAAMRCRSWSKPKVLSIKSSSDINRQPSEPSVMIPRDLQPKMPWVYIQHP
jgi:hypothetical protein